jgi:hypothetical protein
MSASSFLADETIRSSASRFNAVKPRLLLGIQPTLHENEGSLQVSCIEVRLYTLSD